MSSTLVEAPRAKSCFGATSFAEPGAAPTPVVFGDRLASSGMYGGSDQRAVTPVAETPRLAAERQADDAEGQPMPASFERFNLMMNFVFMSNYTVLLPTAHAYAASLGGTGWFAGLMIGASIMPCIISNPFFSRLTRHRYKPVLLVQLALAILGNALYGLGQLFQSRWLLVGGPALKAVMYGAAGPALSLNAINMCAGKRVRSASTATLANAQFLGMGMGPVFAAGLARVSFSVGLLQVNDFTNPGWFFSALCLAMLLWLLAIPEPERRFAQEQEQQQAAASLHGGGGRLKAPWQVAWCLLMCFMGSLTIAVWETSAALVTQQRFGWNVEASSLFMGATFVFGMLGGELVKRLCRSRPQIAELDLCVSGLVAIVGSSASIYWCAPDGAPRGLALGNRVVYAVGSALFILSANLARTYAIAIAMRIAAASGARAKAAVSGGYAFCMNLGRGIGAFMGMGLASIASARADAPAGVITAGASLMLALLAMPGLRHGLRSFC